MENFTDESSDLPVFPELMIRQCAEWPEGEPNSSVQHTFELSIDSELLFLVARGSSINGNVNITQSDEEGDSAVVSIRTHYDDETLLDSIKLCDVVTREGGNGVGLFVSGQDYFLTHFILKLSLVLAPSSSSPYAQYLFRH